MTEVAAETPEKKLSVIIPCWNVAPWLRRCLKSVFAALPEGGEVIAVDDGSTDGTGEILREAALSNEALKVISQENRGVSAVRNRALDEALGEFVFFVDPDDYVEDGFFSVMIAAMERDVADYCIAPYKTQKDAASAARTISLKGDYRYSTNDAIVREYLPRIFGYSNADVRRWYGGEALFARREMASVWRAAFRRELIEKNRVRFDESIVLYEDAVFNAEYLLAANTMTATDRPLYVVTERASGAMSRISGDARRLCRNKLRLLEARKRLDAKSGERIGDLFSASCVFSALEILANLVRFRLPVREGFAIFREYLRDAKVARSIAEFPLSWKRPHWAVAVLFLRSCVRSSAERLEAFLLLQVLTGFAVASLSFLFGGSLGAWQYWLSLCVALGAAIVHSPRALFKVFLLNALAAGLTLFTFSYAHIDASICHLPAAHFMADGWNPVRDSSMEAVKGLFTGAGMASVSDFQALHVMTLPKLSHILAAEFATAFGLFTAMGYPFWMTLFALVLAAHRFARDVWSASSLAAAAFAALAAVNFFIFEHCLLGLVDYPSYAGIAIAAMALVSWKSARAGRNMDLAVFFAAVILVVCNKLGGLVPGGLLLALAIFWGWREKEMRKGLLVFAVSLLLFAIIPYWTAAWHHGSPLYPAHTFRKDVALFDLTGDFTGNADAERMGYLARMVYAWISRPLALWGCRLWHGAAEFAPEWRWDFLASGSNAGFCALLWGGVALSLLRRRNPAAVAGWVLLGAFFMMPVRYIGYTRYVAFVHFAVLLMWTNALMEMRGACARLRPLAALLLAGVVAFAGRAFVRQLSGEGARQRLFAAMAERGGAYAIDEDPSWWTYALKERMAAEGLSLSGPENPEALRLGVDWPLVVSSDVLPSGEGFSLCNFPRPVARRASAKEVEQ